MSRKRYTPEQIIGMLREAEVLLSQGQRGKLLYRRLASNLLRLGDKTALQSTFGGRSHDGRMILSDARLILADFSALLLAVFWIFGIGPVILFGMVLYPSRAIAPYLETESDSLRRTFYFRPTESQGLNGFVQDLKACDWLKEIGYEIMKQSGLREFKRHRFLRALWACVITYLVVATIQILRSLEAFPLR